MGKRGRRVPRLWANGPAMPAVLVIHSGNEVNPHTSGHAEESAAPIPPLLQSAGDITGHSLCQNHQPGLLRWQPIRTPTVAPREQQPEGAGLHTSAGHGAVRGAVFLARPGRRLHAGSHDPLLTLPLSLSPCPRWNQDWQLDQEHPLRPAACTQLTGSPRPTVRPFSAKPSAPGMDGRMSGRRLRTGTAGPHPGCRPHGKEAQLGERRGDGMSHSARRFPRAVPRQAGTCVSLDGCHVNNDSRDLCFKWQNCNHRCTACITAPQGSAPANQPSATGAGPLIQLPPPESFPFCQNPISPERPQPPQPGLRRGGGIAEEHTVLGNT